MRLWLTLIIFSFWLPGLPAAEDAASRLRIIIETDAGGDPDDEQSLVRFLLYANEWDVEGIIANRPQARERENLNRERTGLGIVRAQVLAYGQCYTNLVRHDPRYPSPEQLLACTVAGYADTNAGVALIVAAVDRADPRPLWFCNWGTDDGSSPSCLKRALDKVLKERGEPGYAAFKRRIRLSSADKFHEHTTSIEPPFPLWVDTFRPEIEGRRWYHQFSALTATAGGFNIDTDVRSNHGPLGALYPINTTHRQKEGDTMAFLYLVPTGLSKPEEPTWGGWAGRFGRQAITPGKYYFWANQVDAWHGTTNRDNCLKRWAADLQNDFKARMDWCVQPPNAANHPPRVILNGRPANAPLRIEAAPGSLLTFDTTGTSDPDGDQVRFEWMAYREPGTYDGPLALEKTNSPNLSLRIPPDAASRTLHFVLSVSDSGQRPLTRYARAVVTVRDRAASSRLVTSHCTPPPELANAHGAYRSPLQFADGSSVRTPADWARRRQQLLAEWHELMGRWPPLVESPAFEYLSHSRREHFTQERVRVQTAPDQTSEGWLLVPDGKGPFPSVLVVYYEPETSVGLGKEGLRDFALQLTRRGFVTLSIGTPGGNAWKPALGEAQCQPLSFHAYVAANCWRALASLLCVNPDRIGIVGHSYGGKWAMFGAALWDKFAAVAVSDPGIVFDEARPNVNYWEPWYLGADPVEKRPKAGVPGPQNPRTGAYQRMIDTGRDLHEVHALIAPRPFLVSGGSEDPPSRWMALNHTVTLNSLLGHTNRVAMTNRPDHAPTEESNEVIYAFFEHFLTPLPPY
jgi:hypothetical protein